MSTKDDVLGALMEADAAISGERLARRLGLSRCRSSSMISSLFISCYLFRLVQAVFADI